MNILIIINDAPYGTEKAYNALRMAMTLCDKRKTVRRYVNFYGNFEL